MKKNGILKTNLAMADHAKDSIAATEQSFIDPANSRDSLIKLLHLVALDAGLFDEGSALLGIGAFEEFFEDQEHAIAYTRELIRDLIEATGKRFHGAWPDEAEYSETDLAPDPELTKEEYEADLIGFLEAARTLDFAEDWDLVLPEAAYEMRLTYAEALAFNSGANRWEAWLLGRIGNGMQEEEIAEFMNAAMEYFEEEEIGHFFDIRIDLAEVEDDAEDDAEELAEAIAEFFGEE